MSAPREIIGPRHVERFQCIGSQCEDTCCKSWSINIDRDHARRFLKVLDSPAERDRFRDSITVRQDWATNPHNYATMKLRDDGSCPYLDEDLLCAVHKRHGGDVLWDTCANFPRVYNQTGDRVEVWATLSCPELTRQLLLHEDAVDLVAFSDGRPMRVFLRQLVPARPERPYERYLDDVRITVLRVLAIGGLSLAERLFLLALFGERTAEFFHREAPVVDERRLADELTLVTHPEVHATVRSAFLTLPSAREPVLRLLIGLLNDQLKNKSAMGLSGLVQQVCATAAVPGSQTDDGNVVISIPDMIARYDGRRGAWEAAHGARVERYFGNYAQAYWMREWYTAAPNLAVHGRRLLLRLALMRLLVFCHPKLDGIEPSAEGAVAALDAVAVEVCYRMARGLDHDTAFVERLDGALSGGDVERLEKQLLRF